ncbi:inhibitor of growth protein 1 isoform X1 [Molothrus ater]|uniref:inhibitor of growth protein 1 isoform X1 n=1 Tax=Molothrus ater TaxID=84834 RepID=UPI00174B0AE4|nr:inhibitor of growth protein 1 isoform X1 [Molothrus ater]
MPGARVRQCLRAQLSAPAVAARRGSAGSWNRREPRLPRRQLQPARAAARPRWLPQHRASGFALPAPGLSALGFARPPLRVAHAKRARAGPRSARSQPAAGREWQRAVLEPKFSRRRTSVEILKDLDDYYEKFKRETDAVQKRRMLHCIQRALIRSQELGDEKIQIVSQMVELVENRTRQVDSHVELFETCQETNDTTGNSGKASQDKSKNETITQAEKPNNKRSRRQRNNENRENASNNHDHDDITSGTPKEKKAKTSKKKKRSKAKAEREASPPDLPIDPNEPTYCLCNQVSYGEMIGCDNDECPIEWFHFSCVGLNHKPKGKWYCPKCRGENEKTMDKALEKSKKERAYNR